MNGSPEPASFTLRLDLLGLFVVRQSSRKDAFYRASAADPEGLEDVELEMTLRFENGNLHSVDNLETRPEGLRRTEAVLPKGTILRVPAGATPAPLNEPPFEPATLRELGLGDLREEVGYGEIANGEYGRAVLPATGCRAEWILDLGEYELPAVSATRNHMADRFIWYADYQGRVQLDFLLADGSRGSVVLEPDPASIAPGWIQADIRFKESPESGDPFDFCQVLQAITTVPFAAAHRPVKPVAAPPPPHPGSSSCPPVRYP